MDKKKLSSLGPRLRGDDEWGCGDDNLKLQDDYTSELLHRYTSTLEGPLAVAVSGGSDSMALLLLAQQWAKEGRIVALTVDHGLRPESRQEAEAVGAWAQTRGIEHVILTWEGEKPSARLQEKAREVRYRLLIDWCKENKISTLLLGHHLQDQEETFWLRLSAGSGLDGLSGMKERTLRDGITIVRPLLTIPKEELQAFLKAEGQEWIEDPSNIKETFFRGRFRAFLKEEGLSADRLSKTLSKFQEDADFIHQSLLAAIEEIVAYQDDQITLQKKAFMTLHPALAKRLLSLIMQEFSGASYPPRSTQVGGVLQKLQGSSAFTAGGIYWTQTAEEIYLRREKGR